MKSRLLFLALLPLLAASCSIGPGVRVGGGFGGGFGGHSSAGGGIGASIDLGSLIDWGRRTGSSIPSLSSGSVSFRNLQVSRFGNPDPTYDYKLTGEALNTKSTLAKVLISVPCKGEARAVSFPVEVRPSAVETTFESVAKDVPESCKPDFGSATFTEQ